MTEMNESPKKKFIGYEYKEVVARSSQASFLIDGYENFGWELDGNLMESSVGKSDGKGKKVTIPLKRNRKIVNKTELTRLQRNFEACVKEIETLEESKTSAATAYALALGLVGTAFMAGSTFAVTADPPRILLCIILAVPGFLGWILPYFLYRKTVQKRTGKVEPLIEEKYEEIYELCEKGNRLLY
jgi:hypothetical protein